MPIHNGKEGRFGKKGPIDRDEDRGLVRGEKETQRPLKWAVAFREDYKST